MITGQRLGTDEKRGTARDANGGDEKGNDERITSDRQKHEANTNTKPRDTSNGRREEGQRKSRTREWGVGMSEEEY